MKTLHENNLDQKTELSTIHWHSMKSGQVHNPEEQIASVHSSKRLSGI